MEVARFRFSTEILKRLGEELNPSLDQGIIELVKNSYDADSHTCTVQFVTSDEHKTSIRIVDDGIGMTVDEIRNGWLVLGHSGKTKSDRTILGRVPAGSKGLGRLAALRMGAAVTLITKPKNQQGVVNFIRIDWSDFDRADLVDDIRLEITTSERVGDLSSGTEIVLEDIYTEFSRTDVKRLAKALILLADPFGDDPYGFEPRLEAPEYRDLAELVNKRYFSEADYHLVASLDRNGNATAEVLDWRGRVLFSGSHEDVASGRANTKYNCPPAKFDLWAYILNKSSFSTKSTSIAEVREWLGVFGGVHLYENRLRVAPYGNPGNDWLDINLQRVRNPELRPGTNTSIGRVAVEDIHGLLKQKTDRTGYIETEAFAELRAFAQDAMEWMARERLDYRDKKRIKDRTEAPKLSSKTRVKMEEAIEKVPSKSKAIVEKAFSDFEKSKEKEIHTLKKEVQLYRTLSTAGITAATFAHESSGNPIKVITQDIKAIERRSKTKCAENYEKFLKKPVEGIKHAIGSLSVLGQFTLKLLDHGKRRVGRVNIHEVINNVATTFSPFLEGRKVELQLSLCNGNPYLRGTESEVESIISNLVNNSLNALDEGQVKNKIIRIETEVQEGVVMIRLSDNGPGIQERNVKEIWRPGYSTRPNGTGLGLTIVKDAVADLDGDTSAEPHGSLGGAEFLIELPIIGA